MRTSGLRVTHCSLRKNALILQEDEGVTENLRGATTICPGWGLDRLSPQTTLVGRSRCALTGASRRRLVVSQQSSVISHQ